MMRGLSPYLPKAGAWGYMMGDNTTQFGWLFLTYHVVAALVFLVILVLVAVYLWKKIELLDHEKRRK
ncbi:hypothetical protein HYW87_02965 [Candidatus Roizmanbacteria bacterium]|nr:hypothetical protein [Candidatus Roizmanbacteria bacterium]